MGETYEYQLVNQAATTTQVTKAFRGGIHNCQLVNTEREVAGVNNKLYAGIKGKQTTYDIPADEPMTATVYIYDPDEDDISGEE